ncbi:GNAT family protein [Hyphomicrobium sp. LHD-15]|uniref:GNAT family N-acetyltransferase n=1 Tax=Hyphomicrobium sp. LHD-15 TaxID=3072142 RepID=UPI00280F43A5|nr:GNAT family protein [Hyphomicrobium sp. LHD-15]MDQ8699659.1 GNAT family protein [Hyphomicrobium sp. LHD-15]
MASAPDLKHWTPRPRPARSTLEGRFVRLEPIDAARHGDDLFEISTTPDAADRFRYLREEPPTSRAEFQAWLEKVEASEDPLYFAVVDKASGKASGRQTFLRIEPAHGCIEIGHILWGPAIARKPAATEAHYLFLRHAFDDLGYRRWEWKCNNRNDASKRAAERFGFKPEGLFRQHMITKGESRDTAWYAIIDSEWPKLKRAYEGWLDPTNFDGLGQQRRRLQDLIATA